MLIMPLSRLVRPSLPRFLPHSSILSAYVPALLDAPYAPIRLIRRHLCRFTHIHLACFPGPTYNAGMTLTIGSLFAGIGGLELGLERAGFEVSWQVEINEYARRVLAKHWPDVRRHDDIRTFPPREGSWEVSGICAGFPCQDISNAWTGAGLEGERSGLFFETVRVVQQLQPQFVVLENVAGLLTGGLDRVLGEMAEIGYDASWNCKPAAYIGAPHIRDRVFVLAYPSGEGLSLPEQKAVFREGRGQEGGATTECSWWACEPPVDRAAYGVPKRVDRLKCLGNAVVPQVAEYIARNFLPSP